MKKLIREIHRRSLWQVLGIYVVGSWVALQVVDVLKQNFGLPDWFPAFALALLVLGLPIVLATAFVQEGIGGREEMGPSGPTPTEGSAAAAIVAEAAPRRLFTWRNALLGGAGAALLWGGVALGWLFFGRDGPREAAAGDAPSAAEAAAPDLRSIAVLPFATRSEEKQDEYFAEGMHDDLLTQLAKIDSLTVISRTSVMQYREAPKPIRQIAEELGVATVLEGGVQRSGDRVRVNVQLIDARRDRHLWAETYDEELTAANVFAIQTDLARKIAAALQATLTPEATERLAARPTENLEAYDVYVRGRYVLDNARGPLRENLEEAARLFQRAIAADPNYAPAHAALAAVLMRQWNSTFLSREEALPAARAAAERALALDSALAEAHVAEGTILEAELRFKEAERAHRRAIELAPGDARVHSRYASLLFTLDRFDEAIREARRAVELDPLSLPARSALADVLWWARQWDASIAESLKLLELDPQHRASHFNLGWAYGMKGEHEAAIASFERGKEGDPDNPSNLVALAWAQARAGHREQALELLKRVPERGSNLKEIALVYGELGERDRAFAFLDRAYEQDPGTLRTLMTDPSADALRGDPRFNALVRRLGMK